MRTLGYVLMLATLCVAPLSIHAPAHRADPPGGIDPFLSPSAIGVSLDERFLYLACATADAIAVFDTELRRVVQWLPTDPRPLGLTLSRDGKRLYATCASPASTLCVWEMPSGTRVATIPLGHTAMAPVLSADEKTLYVCHRFENEVAYVDLASQTVTRRVRVPREPVSAALSKDGQYLFVANHLQAGRADAEWVAASISVVDIPQARVSREIGLPNGSTLVRELRISPDGRYLAVVHQLSRFHLPTTQLERGWVNTSALTLVDVGRLEIINTVLLDALDAGAANPWALTWHPDGSRLYVTHAGTHELSVVSVPGLLTKLERVGTPNPALQADTLAASRNASDVPNDLSFLVGLRTRIPLGGSDKGPRCVTLSGGVVWVGNYFSDTLTRIDARSGSAVVESIPLGSETPWTVVRRGEFLFNDASICFQGWQSCSSCHSQDARVDSLNWDNLNDGIGNPKNSKSLLFAHRTPPAMWLGVRSNAYVSVRTGIRNSLFTVQPPDVPQAIDAYMESLRPVPSPYRRDGVLSPAAERGRVLFHDEKVGCAPCHRGEFLTDMKFHDVGTAGRYDGGARRFDTPTLVEGWRTGPYLHDGRAVSIREVLTTFNPEDRHGVTSGLTASQIEDLTEFVLSL